MTTLGPAVAGTWYPGDPSELRDVVDDLFGGASDVDDRPARGVVAPHAGLVYSGAVAASAFATWRGASPERVVLGGPSHHYGFTGLVVPRADAIRTPLGVVPIDTDAIARLARHPAVRRDDRPFGPEHALEIELPFLQRALEDGWRVVPFLTGTDIHGTVADELAEAILAATGPDTPWVASSDFTHHGPRFGYTPFVERIGEQVEDLDRSVLRPAEAIDVPAYEARLDETGATVCGRHAIGLMLRAMPGGSRGVTVAYDTSGAKTGDWTHSVSYAAMHFREPSAT